MICVTGDIHHKGLNSDDLMFCRGSELDSGLIMAEIARDHGLSLTLFVTGRCAEEEPQKLRRLSQFSNVEIGGHNYFGFKPRRPFSIWERLTGLKNGPRIFQEWEVSKTLNLLGSTCGDTVVSWRDHGYRHDRNTASILAKKGIRFWSDALSKDGAQPFEQNGLWTVPINTLPDHDYVFHGDRTKDSVDPNVLLNTAFEIGPMNSIQWRELVIRQVGKLENKNIDNLATLLCHPACMEVFDNFQTFEWLCQRLPVSRSIKMADIERLSKTNSIVGAIE